MLTEPARLALEALSEVWWTPAPARRFLGTWGVGTIAIHRDVREVLRDRFQGRPSPRMTIESNPDRLPEVRSVPRVRFHPSQPEALAAARATGYRFDESAQWVEAVGAQTDLSRDDGKSSRDAEITVLDAAWSRLRLRSRSPAPVSVEIARTWDPGWSARIADRGVPIHRTAIGQMGVRLPAGDITVELAFFDPLVPTGALLSAIGLAGVAWCWRRRPGARKGLE